MRKEELKISTINMNMAVERVKIGMVIVIVKL
jgi:hypothetical protein